MTAKGSGRDRSIAAHDNPDAARHSISTGDSTMTVFTHVTLGTNHLDRARSFYDKVLGEIGLSRMADLGDNGSIWGDGAPSFFVLKPVNG
ncbi:putative enzyme protein, partial [Burkholderia sp. TJI49]